MISYYAELKPSPFFGAPVPYHDLLHLATEHEASWKWSNPTKKTAERRLWLWFNINPKKTHFFDIPFAVVSKNQFFVENLIFISCLVYRECRHSQIVANHIHGFITILCKCCSNTFMYVIAFPSNFQQWTVLEKFKKKHSRFTDNQISTWS